MKKGIAIIAVLAMIMTLFAVPVSAAVAPVVPPATPNYAFIPNSGEASVSKVDLVNMEEVARYYTEPRGTTAEDYNWRTSRIAMDADGNAWVLNTGADGTNLQGSVVRIQADTTGLTTHLYPDPVLDFGTDEAVKLMNVGDPGDMPRAIAIDSEGFIWIGFYSSGALMKYAYTGDTLVPQFTEPIFNGDNKLNYYEMKFAPDGTLYISSRNSTPARTGDTGVWSFNPGNKVFFEEWDVNPYSLLIDPVSGQVYATNYSNQLWIKGVGEVTIEGASQLRGMAFDGLGKIWIANTENHSQGNKVFWYAIGSEPVLSGSITFTVGTTPVGIGKDAAGLMWVVCRTDNGDRVNGGTGGYIVAFDPVTKLFVTDGYVQVGYRPYAYGDFVVPPPPEYEICGMKVDADTQDGLEGWTIDLYKLDETLTTPAFVWLANDVTDVDGMYCFEGLLAGEYKVSEVLQDGWEQDLPIDNEHLVSLPDMASDCEDPETFYNFVNGELYSLCGIKYRSDTQMPLGGWMITLEKSDGVGGWDPVASKVTDINGAYCFEDLRAGVYRIAEVLKTGWTLTDPVIGYHEVMVPEDIGEPISFDFYNEPDMECYDDTIWAYGGEDGAYTDGSAADVVANNTVEGNTSNNWGWTNEITEPGLYVFTLYRGAGQNDLDKGTPVGTLTVDFDGEFAEVTYEVAEPYTLSEVHLWVGDTQLPEIAVKKKGVTTYTPTSAPGQLAKLGFSPEISTDGLSATITVEIDAPFWVAAHGVVNWCEMIPSEDTVYYHWGVGYPYGATPETYAVAMVTSVGMDVWWLQGSQWKHDIYSTTAAPGFTEYAVSNLSEPVKMLHEMHFPGLEHTYYSRTSVNVGDVPVPNAMSIFIP